jgi:MATE family multidrug resistance protein
MPESTSSAVDIDGASRGRRHLVLSDFLPGSLPLPPSFVATAPNVQEILSRDIEDCSSNEEEGDEEAPATANESKSRHVDAADVQLAFHPNGVAYGCGFSTIPLPGIDLPVPNPHEQGESLQAEIDLLRDNDILPPKHPRTGRRASVVERAYRTVFSIRV